VRALGRDVLREGPDGEVEAALNEVRQRRLPCVRAAFRRAQQVFGDGGSGELGRHDGEWLGYAALLVQVDRIVDDLSAPLPP
jgi:hypothetical protein